MRMLQLYLSCKETAYTETTTSINLAACLAEKKKKQQEAKK